MSDVEDYYEGEGGLDWLYVEDHYDETDDLAEHTCPSPVAEAEARADEAVDYDPYNYWEDLEYLSDSYYDDRIPHPGKSQSTEAPSGKRKRHTSPRKSEINTKKPRLAGQQLPITPPLIRWKADVLEDSRRLDPPLAHPGKNETVSLLKDWKERFQGVPGLLRVKPDATDQGEEDTPEGGIDLSNIQSIAGLLTEENLGQLAALLESKGLDPEAMQVVLQDLIAGKEPEFDDDDEEEEVAGAVVEQDGKRARRLSKGDPTALDAGPISAIPHRSLKRKTTEDHGGGGDALDDGNDDDEVEVARSADVDQDAKAHSSRTRSTRTTRSAPSLFTGTAGADPPAAKPRKRSKR